MYAQVYRVRFSAGARDMIMVCNVQTGYVVYPVSYSRGFCGRFPWD